MNLRGGERLLALTGEPARRRSRSNRHARLAILTIFPA